MKTVVKLALEAGRKGQSPQTGMIHDRDLIPLYENFCFILALFRSHISDQVLEGKALLEKLFHFEVEGNFPVNLHEYPLCRDPFLKQKIEPLFFWLLKDFSSLLGEKLKEKVKAFLSQTAPYDPPQTLKTPDDWAHFLIAVQKLEAHSQIPLLEKAVEKWHPTLATFKGMQPHRKKEPATTLFDLFMGELFGTFSKRSLESDPIHLKAALVQPFSWNPQAVPSPMIHSEDKELFIAWGTKDLVHTFVTFKSFQREGDRYVFTLPEEIPPESDQEEVVFYLNFHADHQLFVNEKKATSFQLNDRLQIRSKEVTIELTFEGNALMAGFIALANRPFQPKTAEFTAYDWKIGLRTLRRHPECKIYCKLALSCASPMACIPLST